MPPQAMTCSVALTLLLIAFHARAGSDAIVMQSGSVANEADVEQRNNSKAKLSLVQAGGAHAGSPGKVSPGIVQTDSGRLTTIVSQQGNVNVLIDQRTTDLGWVTVTQSGKDHGAVIAQARSFDVTADIRQWTAGNRSTQLQGGLFNGTADSWQSGSANASRIDQSGSKVVIGFVIQEGSFGDATITQRNVASANAAIRQPGTYNTASIEQADGAGLNAKIRQAGVSQFASVHQAGIDKNADIAQSGAMQRALAWQH